MCMSENRWTHPQAGQRAHVPRQANLELLRCIAMMMVIVLHYLGKGGLLVSLEEAALCPAGLLAWLLESFCIVAVNVYMLISGYFLSVSSFRPSRLIQLWLQVWSYSIAIGLLGALTGVIEETAFDTHFLLTLLFPISMDHYWFLTAYFFLYLLLPFLGTAVRHMTKRQLQIAALLLLFAFSVQKSILPVRLETDGLGYDCLWYVCVFVAAAYIRRFGVGFLGKKGCGAALYVGGCLGIFGGTMLLRRIYLRTGSLERLLQVCMEYNHILPFLAAVGLFGAFLRVRISGRFAAAVCKVSPCTLGVYLLHENLGLRYTWQDWLGAGRLWTKMQSQTASPAALLLYAAAAAVCVFAVGILAEMFRRSLFRLLDRGLGALAPYRKLKQWILGLDECFRRQGEGAA